MCNFDFKGTLKEIVPETRAVAISPSSKLLAVGSGVKIIINHIEIDEKIDEIKASGQATDI